MKIVLVHNRYQEAGGEDAAVAADGALLSERGHVVVPFTRDNDELLDAGALLRARTAAATVWATGSKRDLASLLDAEQPDAVVVHNTFPLLSPSIYWASAAAGVPSVQILHNARLVCASPYLFRDGHRCTDCVGRSVPWPAVAHRCYRGSAAGSAALATSQWTHRRLGTWRRKVGRFVTVSQFLADLLIEAGVLPAEKVAVRPNFLAADPGARTGAGDGSAVFLGRLSPEKGVHELVEASLLVPEVPLVIVGDGPSRSALEDRVRGSGARHVRFTGRRPWSEAQALLREASVAVLGSVCDEVLPMLLVEAAAMGVPALATRVGGVEEVVVDGVSGVLVPPSDVPALAARLRTVASDPAAWAARGPAARARYEARFTADAAYESLMDQIALAR